MRHRVLLPLAALLAAILGLGACAGGTPGPDASAPSASWSVPPEGSSPVAPSATPPLSGSTSAPAEGRSGAPVDLVGDLEGMFDVGDHELYVECRGSGTPTVLFHNGAGSNHHEWDPIYEAVTATTRACRYDLPNTGQSDPLDRVRTVADDITDLHELERQGILGPPYVMVSFSAGALPAWRYAAAHADDVVGMVLTDPLLPGYEEARAAPMGEVEREQYQAQRAGDNELGYDFTASWALLGDPPTFGVTPTVVIANDRHIRWEQCPEDCEYLTPVTQGIIDDLVASAQDARVIRVTSPHWVLGTHRELVRDEVLAMVDRGR